MRSTPDNSNRGYRRGAVMGLTLAEAFVLITFAVLMLLALWRLQVDEELSRYREELSRFEGLRDLSQRQLAVAESLGESGQLELADAIVSDGVNLAVVIERLDELAQDSLSSSEMAAAVVLAESEQLLAASRLVSNGLDLAAGTGFPDEADRWRLIDQDELLRVLNSLEDLPESIQRNLADLVEVENPSYLARIIEETQRALAAEDSTVEEEDPLAAVGQIFDQANMRRAETVRLLRERLGDQIGQLQGATIRDDGTIVLPETVAFRLGSAEISHELRTYLQAACQTWIETLMESPAPISGATIEGHTDSSWNRTDPEQAYLNNLGLSQRRSATVLRECLQTISDEDARQWAQEHLVSIAYSSARLVRNEQGEEDADASRRVEFSIQFDDGEVLEDLASLGEQNEPLSETQNPPRSNGIATISGPVVHVRDGDTFVVAARELEALQFPIRLSGVNCEELGSMGGNDASQFLETLLEGADVTCHLNGDRTGDRYAGRCELQREGDIGALLISQGMCGRCPAYDQDGFYIAAQDIAGAWLREVPNYCVEN